MMRKRLREILARRQKLRFESRGLVPAAVLLLLYKKEGEDEYYILLTRRTESVEHHKGQISLPGGAADVTDSSLEATALRESAEEIGIREGEVEILGELDQITTVSNFVVTPFIATITAPHPFQPNQKEVAELIEVPLSALRKGSASDSTHGDPTFVYGKHIIWGATARILAQFLDLLTDLK